MKIVSTTEMREIDRVTSERFGVPSFTLMENAGTGVAQFVLGQYPAANRIGIFCGKGNNGGDGFVIARKLHEAGKMVTLILLADPGDIRGDAAAMFERLPVKPVVAKSNDDLKSDNIRRALDGDLLIDAILGSGFKPPVSGVYAEAIRALNAAYAPMIAVDIPSGADADVMGEQTGSVARADHIVTFTAPRPAHVFGMLTPGQTVVAPVGSPPEAIVSDLRLNIVTPFDISSFAALRNPGAHKGSFGHVLILGGSFGKAGAAAMAGMASLRAGAGLVTIATAKSALYTAAGFAPELMTEPLAETETGSISLRAFEYGRLDALVEGKEVLAIGPGVSRHPETAEMVRTTVERYSVPIVLDADGLNAFEGRTESLDGRARTLVITPHPGEMSRLAGIPTASVQRDRLTVARHFARDHHLTVVLKGHRTLMVQPDGTAWVNPTGNPGMATGGTGDILTGLISGLIAQNPQHPFEAVLAGVYLHGLAGDVARETMGEHSLIATDLLGDLPEAFRRVRESRLQIASF
jgi:ADP-dependent NAD(P)H-hydrate dehydratase / NAD(P)H-hydrate epimerase